MDQRRHVLTPVVSSVSSPVRMSALLKLLSRMRANVCLMAAYRLLPAAVRKRLSATMSRTEARSMEFRKSPRWHMQGAGDQEGQSSISEAPGLSLGVNVYAFLRGRFGLAESARRYTSALLASGCRVWLYDIADGLGVPHDMKDKSLDGLIGRGDQHGINLVFVNPDYLERAMETHMCNPANKSYTIGVWFWEGERFPLEWTSALDVVDEIMVASVHLENAIRRVTDKPVFRVPLPVDSLLASDLKRKDFGIRESAFVFLSMFDFNSYLERKNPAGVIHAFRLAFATGESDVQLLLKSINGHRFPDEMNTLREAAAGDPRIVIRDDIIENRHVHALQQCADCFVSLHRAEGFGMALAECMWFGKPVIATGWSGNMDFMTPENSCPVRFKLVEIQSGDYAHHQGQRWAEPDIHHAAGLMKRLADDPRAARRIGNQASRDVRRLLSSNNAAALIKNRLEEITMDRLQSLTDEPGRTSDVRLNS